MIRMSKTVAKTHEQLFDIPLERPKGAGAVWQGIQHGELVDALKDQAMFMGWTINNESFTTNKKGTGLAGTFGLTIPALDAPEGQEFSMGFLTSNNMERSLRLVVGTNVFVCHNGMTTGQVVLQRKHTRRLELREALAEGFTEYHAKAGEVKTIVAAMQTKELSPVQVEHALLEAGRRNLMPWSRIGEVDAEYRAPSFKEHGTGTVWALLNAFTWIVKKNPPMQQMQQIDGFRQLLLAT